MHILNVEKLVKRFGGIIAVNHCSFAVDENSITALIGPNGAGKTTMFDLISGCSESDSGEVYFRGSAITKKAQWQRARLGIARTFQAIRVFPELTALDNLLLAMPSYDDSLSRVFSRRSKELKYLREKALELLQKVHLEGHAHARASSLSYGQQKLLEIMRAVATDADLFLLDEPAAGVNRTLLHTIIAVIKELKKEGKAIIIVEHDMGFVMDLSEKIIVMDYGKEIAAGPPHEIQKNRAVLEAYLGVN